jgi:hypothetical protein
LLSSLLWKITEADAHKYKTRFQSQGAMGCTDRAKLRHEHVFQRSRMIEALEMHHHTEVDDILKNAIGCRDKAGYTQPMPFPSPAMGFAPYMAMASASVSRTTLVIAVGRSARCNI